jgi:hypothetical protein
MFVRQVKFVILTLSLSKGKNPRIFSAAAQIPKVTTHAN